MNCSSECDCGAPGGYPHDPDCHSYRKCEDGGYCDKHYAEAEAEFAYLRNVPRHQVYDDQQAKDERNQELRDAGRGHLVRE
jgi:hypothetical protein